MKSVLLEVRIEIGPLARLAIMGFDLEAYDDGRPSSVTGHFGAKTNAYLEYFVDVPIRDQTSRYLPASSSMVALNNSDKRFADVTKNLPIDKENYKQF